MTSLSRASERSVFLCIRIRAFAYSSRESFPSLSLPILPYGLILPWSPFCSLFPPQDSLSILSQLLMKKWSGQELSWQNFQHLFSKCWAQSKETSITLEKWSAFCPFCLFRSFSWWRTLHVPSSNFHWRNELPICVDCLPANKEKWSRQGKKTTFSGSAASICQACTAGTSRKPLGYFTVVTLLLMWQIAGQP